MNIDEVKTPDILLTALRQYQHNDCSGLLVGFDYEETIKIVIEMRMLIMDLQATVRTIHNSSKSMVEQCAEDRKRLNI